MPRAVPRSAPWSARSTPPLPHSTPSSPPARLPAAPATPAGFGHALASITIGAHAPIQCSKSTQGLRRSGRDRKSVDRYRPPEPIKSQVVRKVSTQGKNLYVLPPRSTVDYTGRRDTARLRRHFKAIKQHFRYYKGIFENSTNARKQIAAKGKMTEAIGEMNATNKILSERSHWRLNSGFGPGTGIDQVWTSKDSGKLNIVEAKGPGAKLGISDRKGPQMSEQWVRMTAEGLLKKKGGNDFGIVDALKRKGKPNVPKVRGYVITSTSSGKRAKTDWDKLSYK